MSNFKKLAAAVAVAAALAAGVVGTAGVDDGAANGLKKVSTLRANGL